MLCEMRMTATPSSLSRRTRSSTLRRLAQAQGRGRLVEDDELGGERDGPGDRDGLALTARHQRHLGVEVGQADLEPVEQLARSGRPSSGAA